jgi:pimeloyl-ACP methyl ester carboxylesterase
VTVEYTLTEDVTRIAYSVTGSGPPLVLVRGWITHLDLMWAEPAFRAFVEALAQRFRVVRYDTRGNGLSDREVAPPDLDALVDDLTAVMDAAAVDRAVLWGSCFGGPVAIAYAARRPDRVERLVLEGTYPTWEDTRTPRQRRAVGDLMRMLESAPDMASTAISYLTDPAPGARHEERAQRILASVDPRYLTYLYALATEIDVRSEAEGLRVPTLVVHARESQVYPARDAQVLARAIPGAQYLELDSAQHNPWEGEAAQVVQAVCGFAGVPDAEYRAPGRARVSVMVFTDLVESTGVADRYGDLVAADLRRAHDAIVATSVRAHGGDVVKYTGDGALARFSTASQAIRAAELIVGAAEDHNAATDGPPLAIRVGLNAGEPIEEAGDLHGTAVNLAARVCAQARGNEVIVSAAVRDLASGKGFRFTDCGAVRLKGFAEPTHLLRLEPQRPGPSGRATP